MRVDTLLEPDVDEKQVSWVPSACVLCSNGCGLDIGVQGRQDRRRPRPGGRPGQPRPARAQGAPRLAGEQQPRPAHAPARPRGGQLARRPTWDEAMGLVVSRSRRRARRAHARRGRLLQHRPALPRGVLHARGHRARRASARRIWTATPGSAPRPRCGAEGDVRLRRPARLATPTSTRPTASSSSATTWPRRRPSCGRGSSTACAGPNPPRLVVVDPRRTETAQRGRRPPRRRGSAPTSPLLNGLLHLLIEDGQHRPRLRRRAHGRASTSWRETVASYPPERCGGDHRRPRGRQLRAAAEMLGRRRAARLDRAPGRLPVEPGDRGGVPGEQRQPHPRDDRPARLRRPPDERPADRPEHPRDRLRRRVPVLPQLAEPRARRRAGRALERRRRCTLPHWAPPTHAMEIFRHAEPGSIKFLWVIGTNPAVSLPELHRIRKILARTRACSSSCRTPS